MLWCPNKLCHVILDVLAALGEKIIFLDFSRSGTQIIGGQNTVLITAPSLYDISSAMRGVR